MTSNLASRAVERRRQALARELRGRGLEIGALRTPTTLPHASDVLYSDILTAEQLDRLYPGSKHPDIISDSERFPDVPDNSFDFVVANHVLEHVSNPIGALEEWHRILRPGGLLLMALPDKRFTFDRRRQRTSLAHLLSDYNSDLPAQQLNARHLLEWAQYVEQLEPGTAQFERWVAGQLERGYSVHNHVWIVQDVFDVLVWINTHTHGRFVVDGWHNSSPLTGEFVLLLRAVESAEAGTSSMGLTLARFRASLQDPVLHLGAVALRIASAARRAFRDSRGSD